MTEDTTSTRPAAETRTRRRLLAAVGAGATAGLAGCLDDVIGGGSGTNTEDANGSTADAGSDDETETDTDTGDGETQAISCEKMDEGGYRRYDEADSPFVGTFEYPGDVALTSCVNGRKGLTIRTTLGDRQPFDLIVVQDLSGTDSRTDAMQGDVDGLQQVGTLEFGDDTLPLVRSSGGPNADEEARYQIEYPYYVVGLPRDGPDGTTFYRFDLRATVSAADQLEPTDCEETWADVSERVIRSLEPNADTTIESTDGC